jgi:hypothetical protein
VCELISVGRRFSAGHPHIDGLDMSGFRAPQKPRHLAERQGIKDKDGATDA